MEERSIPSTLLVYVDEAIPGYDDMVEAITAAGGILVKSPSQAFMSLRNVQLTVGQNEPHEACGLRLVHTVLKHIKRNERLVEARFPLTPTSSSLPEERDVSAELRHDFVDIGANPLPDLYSNTIAPPVKLAPQLNVLPDVPAASSSALTPTAPSVSLPHVVELARQSSPEQPIAGPSRTRAVGRATWRVQSSSVPPSPNFEFDVEPEVDELDSTQNETPRRHYTPNNLMTPKRMTARQLDALAFIRHANSLPQTPHRSPPKAIDSAHPTVVQGFPRMKNQVQQRARDYLLWRWSTGDAASAVPLRYMDEAAIYDWVKVTALVSGIVVGAKFTVEDLLQMVVQVGLNMEPFRVEGRRVVRGLPWYPRDNETKCEWIARLGAQEHAREQHRDEPQRRVRRRIS